MNYCCRRGSADRAKTACARIAPWARLIAIAAALLATSVSARAADPAPDELQQLREEMKSLREENAANRALIEALQQKLEHVDAEQAATAEALAEEREQNRSDVAAAPPGDRLDSLLGDNRFVVTGWGAAGFDWERESDESTFSAVAAPILLFRVGDRVLFEMEPELEFHSDGDLEVNLEYAQADVILNDYMTLVAGKFLLPFGDFIQQLHPAWINKLASSPLPYREGEEGGLLPFSDLGAQLRGGTRLFDSEGVDLDYSLFVTNGPRFEEDEIGAPFISNNVDLNKGKGFGARVALYPFPLAREIGRLKLGASTYNGTWDEGNDLWFYSWGIDAAYQLDELELRGEYLQTWRELMGESTDRRDGWYVQAAYKLSRFAIDPLNRLELVARYSGLDQRALTGGDEERFADPQQLALGLNYWLRPSVVARIEYDYDFLKGTRDDQAVRLQLAVGF